MNTADQNPDQPVVAHVSSKNPGWPSIPYAARRTTGALWTMAPLWYLLCEALAATNFPGYDYGTFYISDLGVSEQATFEGRELMSQLPQVMNAGFIGAGVLFLIGLTILIPFVRRGLSGGVFIAASILHVGGIVFVGLVPGSPSNAATGLIAIHAVAAFAAIVGGNTAAMMSSSALSHVYASRRKSMLGPVLGVFGLLSGVLLILHFALPDGVWERGAVYAFFAWQLFSGLSLLRFTRPDPLRR